RLEDQHLHPAPQLVLVRVAPDPPHLGQRVPLDHASTLSIATAARCSAASAAATITVRTAISAATLSVTPTQEAASATTAALPARNRATPQPIATHGPAGSVLPVFTMACFTPEASATIPSSMGM